MQNIFFVNFGGKNCFSELFFYLLKHNILKFKLFVKFIIYRLPLLKLDISFSQYNKF